MSSEVSALTDCSKIGLMGVTSRPRNSIRGYHSAANLGLGMAAAALLLSVQFVRIPKDNCQGWDEEDGQVGGGAK